MQVISGLENIYKIKDSILTQGTFDGVHTGHLKILNSIVSLAKVSNCKSVLLTFDPHPRQILSSENNNIKLLSSLDEKLELLENTGLDYVIVINFDKNFAEMSAEDFVKKILVEKIGVKTMVVGYDHRFGRNREGTFADLEKLSNKYNFNVKEIEAFDIENAVVSSTKIRKSLLQGDVLTANKYIGRFYQLGGTVIEGKRLGTEIGYPTANIKVDNNEKLIPANGVYAVKVKYKNKLYGGMLNIGNRPTIQNAKWSVEVNIFEFNKNIYNENLTIYFISRMREEKKFDSIEELKNQLTKDKHNANKILEKIELEDCKK
ncbi:MAG: bifunctional riboflavin kinase/FAD synthetase [Bacteroidia bacterium]|nr:bifunctional riboflavin kinase/FAD synthetase [Bacteroidia bacterium]